MQALLSPAPRSRVLARLASLVQIGELARGLWDGMQVQRKVTPQQPMRFFLSFLSSLLSQGFVVGGGGVPFFSTGVFQCDRCPFISFCLGPGRMGGLCCCASHGGINYFYLGAGANSGSPWILQAPNLHFNDAVILLTLYIKNVCFDSHQ